MDTYTMQQVYSVDSHGEVEADFIEKPYEDMDIVELQAEFVDELLGHTETLDTIVRTAVREANRLGLTELLDVLAEFVEGHHERIEDSDYERGYTEGLYALLAYAVLYVHPAA